MHLLKEHPLSRIPENWEKEESAFTDDHVIDAYLKGRRDGRTEMARILTKQFNDNIKIATTIAEKLFSIAAKKNIHLYAIHLKADSITNFSALFIVNKENFVSEKFRDILIAARKLKNEVETDSFYISFLFTPESGNLNEKSITTDGFFLKYEKK